MGGNFSRRLKTAAAVLAGATLAITSATAHAQDKPIRIGLVTVGNIKYYALERVQPPEAVKSLDWIKSGMKPGK